MTPRHWRYWPNSNPALVYDILPPTAGKRCLECGYFTKVMWQELCESRGGRPGLSVITSLLVSVDVKLYWTMLTHWSQLVPNIVPINRHPRHPRTLSNTTAAAGSLSRGCLVVQLPQWRSGAPRGTLPHWPACMQVLHWCRETVAHAKSHRAVGQTSLELIKVEEGIIKK